VKRNGTKRYICETKRTETNQNNNVPKPWKKVIVAGSGLKESAFSGLPKSELNPMCHLYLWTWAVIFSMAMGDVQRNRIIKPEHGVIFFFCRIVLFLFSFHFFSFLGYFVSFRFRFRGISFRFVFTFIIFGIYWKYWFHSKNFEKLFLLESCFLPIKSHKTWKKH
jgi:hypothetical protein